MFFLFAFRTVVTNHERRSFRDITLVFLAKQNVFIFHRLQTLFSHFNVHRQRDDGVLFVRFRVHIWRSVSNALHTPRGRFSSALNSFVCDHDTPTSLTSLSKTHFKNMKQNGFLLLNRTRSILHGFS